MENLQEYLLKNYLYLPDTGEFFRKRKKSNVLIKGNNRDFRTKINGKSMFIPYLIWCYVYGELPKGNLGFKDGNCRNTKLDNFVPLWDNGEGITKERLQELFTYEEKTGLLYRNYAVAGSKTGLCGSLDNEGYLRTKLFGKIILVHRLIWIYSFGSIDDNMVVDHINHIKTDNRLSNLRLVTRQDNAKNMKKKNDRCLPIGVYEKGNSYCAKIKVDNNSIYLGTYDTITEAVAARQAANKLYKFHCNHGKE